MDLNQEHRYTMQQKLSFTMLVIFGIIIVVLGFLQMRNTIYTPFVIRSSDFADAEGTPLFENEQVKLQSIDTDHDGLNDYEELNFYTTSPYLPDTDSDSFDDKTEIANHTDPTCPEGKKCTSAESVIASSTSSGVVPVLGDQTDIGKDPGAGSAPSDQILQNLGSLAHDPVRLRELMLRAGTMTKEELDEVDDATILQLAQSLIAQQYGVGVLERPTSTVSSATSSP